jgi:propanol-preferring alcohol dehydrogenase
MSNVNLPPSPRPSLPESMQAAVACAIPTESLVVTEVPTPTVEANTDLVVRVTACGICGTDLHILAGRSYKPKLPFVLGHEPVGVVVATGNESREWLGRRIVITLFTGCGACAACRRGDERLCQDLRSITGVLGVWGGYASYMRVHAPQAVEVPAALSDLEAASLVDAGATAMNAVRQTLEREPKTALIVGGGPIAFLTAELLDRAGVSTKTIARNRARREVLQRLGHDAVSSFDEITPFFDAVVDCAGVPEVAVPSLRVLGPKGIYVLAGYARIPDLDLAVVSRKELQILGVRSGSRRDLERSLVETAEGRMRLPEIRTWPLADIDVALDKLRRGDVLGKAVILPPTPPAVAQPDHSV